MVYIFVFCYPDSENLPYPLAPKEAFTAITTPPPAAAAAKPASPMPATTSTDTGIATSSSTGSHSSTTSSQQKQLSQVSLTDNQDDGAVGGTVTAGETTEVDAEEELSLAVGDAVMIGVNENKLRDLQEDYGGVSDSMIKVSSPQQSVESSMLL